MKAELVSIPLYEYQLLVGGLNEISKLRAKIVTLESRQNVDIGRLALDIDCDRQRLTKLEKVKPQPLQKDRGEILRALITANGGKMLAKDARQKMHLSKPLFSMLLATMKDCIEVKSSRLKGNQKLLVLI